MTGLNDMRILPEIALPVRSVRTASRTEERLPSISRVPDGKRRPSTFLLAPSRGEATWQPQSRVMPAVCPRRAVRADKGRRVARGNFRAAKNGLARKNDGSRRQHERILSQQSTEPIHRSRSEKGKLPAVKRDVKRIADFATGVARDHNSLCF